MRELLPWCCSNTNSSPAPAPLGSLQPEPLSQQHHRMLGQNSNVPKIPVPISRADLSRRLPSGCQRDERGLRAEGQRQHRANPRNKNSCRNSLSHLRVANVILAEPSAPALHKGHPLPRNPRKTHHIPQCLFVQEEFQLLEERSRLFLNQFNSTSSDKAAGFARGGIQQDLGFILLPLSHVGCWSPALLQVLPAPWWLSPARGFCPCSPSFPQLCANTHHPPRHRNTSVL